MDQRRIVYTPTLDPDALVQEIRRAALTGGPPGAAARDTAARRLQAGPDGRDAPGLGDALGGGLPAGSLRLQPRFEPPEDGVWHVQDLLAFYDAAFVHNAYVALLGRPPDAAGFQHFVSELRRGGLTRVEVLARLRFSREGRARRVKVRGLLLPAAVRQLGRTPVLGYAVRWVVELLRLPEPARQDRRFEAHAVVQLERVAEYANLLRQAMERGFGEVAGQQARAVALEEAQAAHGRRLESLARRQEALGAELQALALQREQLARTVDRLAAELEEARSEARGAASSLREAVNEARAGLDALRALETRTAGGLAALEAAGAGERRRSRALEEALAALRMSLAFQERRVAMLLEEVGPRLPAPLDETRLGILAAEERHALDALYVAFEERFRGSREEIRERFRVYLPLVDHALRPAAEAAVLDLGCGRGEWLELLGEAGFAARGVDLNREMVEQCRARGLGVAEADALEHLAAQPDRALGVLTAFQLVEHLPFGVLLRLLAEAARVLRPGGLLLLETPNPENVRVGSHTFYLDPTHERPIPCETLRFLVEAQGFCHVHALDLNPAEVPRLPETSELAKRFNAYFYGPRDYAIVGWKPAV